MSDARVYVAVREIERRRCSYCEVDGRSKPVTHEVVIEGWYRFAAGVGRIEACEKHALEAAEAIKASQKRLSAIDPCVVCGRSLGTAPWSGYMHTSCANRVSAMERRRQDEADGDSDGGSPF